MSAGVTFGAACTLSSVEEVLRKAVAELPSYKTEIFQAALEQLRWFAGPQIRNVAVSDSGVLGTGTESLVCGDGLPYPALVCLVLLAQGEIYCMSEW